MEACNGTNNCISIEVLLRRSLDTPKKPQVLHYVAGDFD